ncbi:MAG TPA: acyl-CoA dehydrogenase family protein [Terriglobia bacterium]|jgi:glutaryl-CoA dehydrogenase|nr:acyl-CoA dehydrogenase family protein [Terriglobia bacterium]
MFPFHGVDYLELDSLLSDEEKLVRRTVREFVDKEVLPSIEEWNREAKFPKHLVPLMAELGFFGANLKGYGCAEMSNVQYGLIMQELERGDSGLRSFVSVQGALVMYPIHEFGSEEQKERWLPAMQQGKALGCFGLTEPDFGSNPAGMRTRARKDGDSFILNGEKAWITSGTIADVAVVWARAEDGIRGFLVEKGTPGYTSKDIKGKWSLRASVTSTLALQDVRVPASAMLPNAKGLKGPLSCLTQARYGIGWGAIGAAMACYNEALEYAKTRKQFDDKPIASHQLVQAKLADMITEITKAQLLALQVGRLKDRGRAEPAHVSMLKRNNVKIALDIARAARDILGANGVADEYPIFRHMCNLESVFTYEGTHNIHTLVIGEKVTGVPAYK